MKKLKRSPLIKTTLHKHNHPLGTANTKGPVCRIKGDLLIEMEYNINLFSFIYNQLKPRIVDTW